MKLTHPGTKTTINVREDMADMYLSQGWTRVEAPAAPAKKAAAKKVTPPSK